MTTSEVMTTKFTDSSEGKFWKYFAKGDETRFFDERNLAGNINIDAPCLYNLQWKNGIRDDCGSNRVSCDGSDIRAIESYPGTLVWRFAEKKKVAFASDIYNDFRLTDLFRNTVLLSRFASIRHWIYWWKVCFDHCEIWLSCIWKSESRQRRETSLKRTRGFNDVLDNRKKNYN